MPPQEHLVTVALEDYFQVGAFHRLISREQWYRFETRLERNVERTLDLLERNRVHATFFVLGWIADHYPEIVRRVAEMGHEIASKGYYHRPVQHLSPQELRDELARAREAIQRACREKVLGYRLADGWLGPDDLWIHKVLAEEGYAYDSSIAPRFRQFADEPWRRFEHEHQFGDRTLWELPIPTIRFLRWAIPIGGGNYIRQFPNWLVRRAIRRWDQVYGVPFLLYFHVWELDPDQPRISSASWMTKLRHYRNLHKMEPLLEELFQTYRFTGVADYLGLSTELSETELNDLDRRAKTVKKIDSMPVVADEDRIPVTIVVPCCNEEEVLPYLGRTLASVREHLSLTCDLSFVFVDDGSTDQTLAMLEETFGDWPSTRIVRHETNQGVAASICTGVRAASTELVCSIDCDCSYDPHRIDELLSLMTDTVDVVTASPYHPQGEARNVPGWRLFLSRGASWLYRRVLRQKLSTYTSCFRLYRRSKVLQVDVAEKGFLGVAELLAKLDLMGAKIVEWPAVLEVRMLGQSKMKTLRAVFAHLRLLARLAWLRVRGIGTLAESEGVRHRENVERAGNAKKPAIKEKVVAS